MNREELAKKIITEYRYPENLLISVSMRFGKTFLSIQLIDKVYQKDNNIRVLYITPNSQLRDVDIPNEFKKWGYEYLLSNVTILCYSSLHKVIGDYDIIVLDRILSN